MTLRLAGRAGTDRRGAAALEMVIVVPFLVFMFAVGVDYCRIYNTAQVVNNAARSGALYASSTVNATGSLTPQQDAQNAAITEAASLNPPLAATDVTVTVSASSATVTVTYPFRPISPYLGLPAQIAVKATVTMPLSATASP